MKRLLTQIVFFLLQNPLFHNFYKGEIYQGELKKICTPGLNCYSCPAAVTSCPVGSMQLFLAGAKHNIGLFVMGFLLTTGVIFGRFICGYLCPMGLLQDLLYKIKTPKLRPRLRFARYTKYLVLLLFVIILPVIVRNEFSTLGSPWFCKYICPTGTIFGAAPLVSANENLRDFIGTLFFVKAAIAIGIVAVSVIIFRFFCRVLCPLGAFYGLFNKLAFLRLSCDPRKCTLCGRCSKACQIRLNPVIEHNSPECVRCGDCVKSCNERAIGVNITMKRSKSEIALD